MIQNGAIAHERLAIVDPESGEQPLCHTIQDTNHELTLAVNGEIYNHLELRATLSKSVEYTFRTGSDCECILPLYLQHGSTGITTALNELKGMFGFVLHDARDNSFVAVRDYMGIIPLYIGWGADGSVVVASELKAMADQCVRFQCFPPGHLYDSHTNSFVQWYTPTWYNEALVPTQNIALDDLRAAFTNSVKRRMMSDVPWGVLLSGGLDSSLVRQHFFGFCRVDAVLPGIVFCCCLFVGWVLLCQGLCIGWLSGRYCFARDYFSLSGTTLCLFVRDDSLSRDCFNTVSPSHTTPLFLSVPAVDLPPTGGVGRLPFVERRRFRLQPQPHRHQQLWEQDPFLLHWVGGQPGFSGGENSGGLFRYVWVLLHGGGGVVCSFLIISVGQKFGGQFYLGV